MSVFSWVRRHLNSAVIACLPLALSLASIRTGAGAQIDAASDPKLYPGYYIAFCKPAVPGICICGTESQEQVLTFSEFSEAIEDYLRDAGDPRYAKMLDRFRQQCAPAMQTASPR